LRFAPLLLALPLLLTGCSGDTKEPDPLSTGDTPSNCPTGASNEVDPRCVSEGPEAPPEIPFGDFPKTSAEIAAVTIPSGPGELARGGNDVDPSLTTRTFEVTVPAGSRLLVTVACNGATFLDATTEPDSLAEVNMSCFEKSGGVSELAVGDTVVQKSPTRFSVTVKTSAPSRWFASVSATTEALPTPEQ
jgi:hypothetical protein